jgi:hypothetical protein
MLLLIGTVFDADPDMDQIFHFEGYPDPDPDPDPDPTPSFTHVRKSAFLKLLLTAVLVYIVLSFLSAS